MISAGGIPTIDGDLDALASHAREISTVGVAFAGTGEQVHATWQGLSAVYDAPEAGQLVAATGPVRSVSASVGADFESAGRTLGSYAAEIRDIKARLDALRAEAGAFEQSVQGDDNWTEDGAKVDRNNQLIGAVNAAVADFDAAQRRCANAINALYGGQQYRADDGDGQQEPGEYGHTAEQLDAVAGSEQGLPWGRTATEDPGLFSSIGHGILDVAGLVPVVGEAFDGINALWYAAEGDTLNASLSAAGMIPFLGWGATGTKAAIKGADAVRSAGDVAATVNRAGRAYPNVTDPRNGLPIPPPPANLPKVPVQERVPWGAGERGAYIKEWYDKGYDTPPGGWATHDIHHITPREYGGTNNFNNLVPVKRDVHQQEFNGWWRGY